MAKKKKKERNFSIICDDGNSYIDLTEKEAMGQAAEMVTSDDDYHKEVVVLRAVRRFIRLKPEKPKPTFATEDL